MNEQDRYDANIGAYIHVASTRISALEQQLQAAQAECAALRATLADVSDVIALVATHPDLSGEVGNITDMIDAALSGDAGAVFLREHEAMKRVVEHARLIDGSQRPLPYHEFVAARANLRALLSQLDALTAPAAKETTGYE